jgi:hypothetical protein
MSIYTKQINLAESPAVRRWGIAGARRFWLGWGVFMYAFLASVSGYLLVALTRSLEEPSSRLIVYIAVVFIVTASALLTRMLVRVLAELSEKEPANGREAAVDVG